MSSCLPELFLDETLAQGTDAKFQNDQQTSVEPRPRRGNLGRVEMKKVLSPRIKLTSSRIAKGLLAIPKRYHRFFPKRAAQVDVLLGDAISTERKRFTPFKSLARECRIYGLRDWFDQQNAQTGDCVELSVVETANAVYRLVFRQRVAEEHRWREALQSAETEDKAAQALSQLAKARWQSRRTAAFRELRRLAQIEWERQRVDLPSADRYERTPPFLREILATVYGGRCQVCGFTFLERDGRPYFEIHHIHPDAGHQPQNLLGLCANCHAQMEHAKVDLECDPLGWVRSVVINRERKSVHQALGAQAGGVPVMALLVGLVLAVSCYAKTCLN